MNLSILAIMAPLALAVGTTSTLASHKDIFDLFVLKEPPYDHGNDGPPARLKKRRDRGATIFNLFSNKPVPDADTQRSTTSRKRTEASNKSRNNITRPAVAETADPESQPEKLRPEPDKSITQKPVGLNREAEPKTSKLAALPNQERAALASEPAAPRQKANKFSCEDARVIITKYAFSNVTPTSCDGDIYNFTAMRSGKPYTVKISSSNGELTEVRRSVHAEIKSTGQ